MIHWWVRKPPRGPNNCMFWAMIEAEGEVRRLYNRFKPPSIFILTVPRRYFRCGSLLFLLSVFILWFIYYVSDIFCKILGSWMTTYLGKSCSFCLPRVPFVNCRQFMYLVISLLVLRAGYGIWLYQFLIIAYLFTLVGCKTFTLYKTNNVLCWFMKLGPWLFSKVLANAFMF